MSSDSLLSNIPSINRGMAPPSSSPRLSGSLLSYQFATSPDIIRSNQKDVFEISTLSTSLTDLLRQLYGSRFTHSHLSGIETVTHLLYFSLTTFIGNRTLGEEYTDLYQIEISRKERGDQKLPAVQKRASYILLSVLFPYTLSKMLPAFRGWVKHVLDRSLESGAQTETKTFSRLRGLQGYLLAHLSEILSPGLIHAFTLTLFYFSGSYYHLSKRLLGMRYIFSKRLSNREEDARVGYEILGLLLVVQMLVQGCMHLRNALQNSTATSDTHSLDENGEPAVRNSVWGTQASITSATHTPLPTTSAEFSEAARYNLKASATMAWIQPSPPRNCTLCLEHLKDPSVATCGHVFCWTCILDWVREKAECPLCRQGILRQHILPLRG